MGKAGPYSNAFGSTSDAIGPPTEAAGRGFGPGSGSGPGEAPGRHQEGWPGLAGIRRVAAPASTVVGPVADRAARTPSPGGGRPGRAVTYQSLFDEDDEPLTRRTR